MRTKTLKPSEITYIENMTPNDVTYLQDSPSSIDANHISVVDQTLAAELYLKFQIEGELVGTQTVNLVFQDPNWVGVHIEIFENDEVKHISDASYTGYNNIITSFPFDSSVLDDRTGKNMIVRVRPHTWEGLGIDFISAVELQTNFEPNFHTEWTASDFYNFEDLDRVETNTDMVREKLQKFRNMVIVLNIVNNRNESTIEFADSLNRIESNISELVSIFDRLQSQLDTMKTDWSYNQSFSFTDAIRLERNLSVMFDYIKKNEANIPYCGRYIVGQEGVF